MAVAEGFASARARVHSKADAPETVTLQLRTGASVVGRVTGPDGAGLAGADNFQTEIPCTLAALQNRVTGFTNKSEEERR